MLIFAALCALALVTLVAVTASRGYYLGPDAEEEVTETTVEDMGPSPDTHSAYGRVEGQLTRFIEGGKWYVTDPADKDKVEVNPKDDLYEDGGGKVWYLVSGIPLRGLS